MPEFCGVDETISFLVKDLEALYEVLHGAFLFLPLARQEDWQELLEAHSLAA